MMDTVQNVCNNTNMTNQNIEYKPYSGKPLTPLIRIIVETLYIMTAIGLVSRITAKKQKVVQTLACWVPECLHLDQLQTGISTD